MSQALLRVLPLLKKLGGSQSPGGFMGGSGAGLQGPQPFYGLSRLSQEAGGDLGQIFARRGAGIAQAAMSKDPLALLAELVGLVKDLYQLSKQEANTRGRNQSKFSADIAGKFGQLEAQRLREEVMFARRGLSGRLIESQGRSELATQQLRLLGDNVKTAILIGFNEALQLFGEGLAQFGLGDALKKANQAFQKYLGTPDTDAASPLARFIKDNQRLEVPRKRRPF